jgi:hypothetical protein
MDRDFYRQVDKPFRCYAYRGGRFAYHCRSCIAGLSGADVFHYWLSLILLGLGWNFGFTGASAKIIDYHRQKKRHRYSL